MRQRGKEQRRKEKGERKEISKLQKTRRKGGRERKEGRSQGRWKRRVGGGGIQANNLNKQQGKKRRNA